MTESIVVLVVLVVLVLEAPGSTISPQIGDISSLIYVLDLSTSPPACLGPWFACRGGVGAARYFPHTRRMGSPRCWPSEDVGTTSPCGSSLAPVSGSSPADSAVDGSERYFGALAKYEAWIRISQFRPLGQFGYPISLVIKHAREMFALEMAPAYW
ncbi:hypothetical protein AnigIFM63604_008012 [Aspergillus niger]|uniref:Secreted protein n=3 Tax=Aspergillus TaxID=5052 RepID=A2Q7R8_ASPNC|nr:uncharacterized protein BO96DRAFT_347955 [Aspergillus niger CBS 101883]XP_059603078.1 hypothetical protein An01g01700 [Aspergillus niger]RDK46486.1 hypothetical protein M752DRAFT_309981 [Aspergillus phoenicis ATCC 13157]PYH52293.1 hypothetical protein BO96DRAFT_347955 [Aspergillus niger CBS 101883]CAK43541.1 hypothetical protein An01g01700 [Aspergillus niger]GJP94526.1 uncharacterized protein AlacWU_07425 [Aspergillus niger]GLA23972.1 hypothetical protein AnigIFM63326_010430 [Aspergillus n